MLSLQKVLVLLYLWDAQVFAARKRVEQEHMANTTAAMKTAAPKVKLSKCISVALNECQHKVHVYNWGCMNWLKPILMDPERKVGCEAGKTCWQCHVHQDAYTEYVTIAKDPDYLHPGGQHFAAPSDLYDAVPNYVPEWDEDIPICSAHQPDKAPCKGSSDIGA